jgi:capsular polysaccharide biosynthesis protein
MTEVTKRALFKTAITIGIIAILFAIATVWPSIIGYIVIAFIASVFIGIIYMFFYAIEDTKTWRRR